MNIMRLKSMLKSDVPIKHLSTFMRLIHSISYYSLY